MELKQYRKAVDALERVERMDPTEILVHFYLSRTYAGLGKTDEAWQEAELHSRMLAQQSAGPTDEDRKREQEVWAQARQLLVEHRDGEARQMFAKSATGPAATAGTPYALVGALYLSMGDAADAARNLKHALEVEPSVRDAHTYLWMLALQQGDFGEADASSRLSLRCIRMTARRWRESARCDIGRGAGPRLRKSLPHRKQRIRRCCICCAMRISASGKFMRRRLRRTLWLRMRGMKQG